MITEHSSFGFCNKGRTLQIITATLFICFCICLVQSSVTTSIPDQNITVKNFSCITYGWEGVVECTWDYDGDDVKNVSIKWQLIYFKTVSNGAWNECPGTKLNSCTLELNIDIDIDRAFRLCIGVSEHEEFCNIVNIQALVKPKSVQKLKIIYTKTTAVTLQWNHNRYFNKTFQLIINSNGLFSRKVFVQFEYINSNRQLCSTDSRYSVTCERKVMKINLTHLSKYTLYTFSVSSKPLNNGFWSDERYINIQTAKDVPSVPPNIRPGSYSVQLRSEMIRVFTVYWQPLQKKTWNGERITYIVHFMVKSKVIRRVVNTTDCSATLHPVSDEDIITVVLWAQNEIGPSKERSQILIYNKDHQYVDEILAVKNQQYTTDVSWKHSSVKFVKFYEAFWCEQAFANICKVCDFRDAKLTHNLIKIISTNCSLQSLHENAVTNTPSSTRISSKQSNFTIDGHFNDSSSYLFGVSYTTSDNVTSGFIWSDCFIDLTANESALNLESSLHPEKHGMRIKWWFTKCNFKTVLKQLKFYRIDICSQKDCKDYVERKISSIKHTILLDKSELKQVVCTRVTAEWNTRKQKSSPVVCIKVDHNDGDVGPILLAVGAVFTILALFGCFMVISKAMGLVEKARKPLTFELPVLNNNTSVLPENSNLLDT